MTHRVTGELAAIVRHTVTHPTLLDDGDGVNNGAHDKEHLMPKYLIERDLPGLGTMSSDEMAATACASNDVLARMAPHVQWLHSHVTADKMYCVYIADDADVVREHARCGGFPADVVNRITQTIDPTTAEVA